MSLIVLARQELEDGLAGLFGSSDWVVPVEEGQVDLYNSSDGADVDTQQPLALVGGGDSFCILSNVLRGVHAGSLICKSNALVWRVAHPSARESIHASREHS